MSDGTHANPFFNRQRIKDPQYFVGRKHELEALYSAIVTRQCRALIGERKLGKSTLLTMLMHPQHLRAQGLDPDRYVFVYIDLEGMANIALDEFWPEVLDRLAAALPASHDDLRTLTDDLALSLEVRFMQVRRLLRRYDRAGLTVVLMLDEFESLAGNESFSAGFYGELRSLAGELGVVYITASKRSLYDLTYHHADTLSSPFFNIFSDLRLGLFTRSEAEDLLDHLSTLSDMPPFTEYQRDTLIDIAGPHPFFLQVAGSYLYQAQHDGLNEEDAIEKMLRRFLAEAEDHYRYLWSQLNDNEQDLLRRLDLLSPEAARALVRKALVRETTDGHFEPFGEAFAEFLRRSEPTSRPGPSRKRGDTTGLTGTTLGNYRVLTELGRGGMAVVYQGYQPALDRYVAIKVMSDRLSDDPTYVERFQREAAQVARLRHQHVVQMIDFGVHDDLTYMVMEFIDGDTLKQRMYALSGSHQRLSLVEVAHIVRGVAAALDYAHAHGIVHRDIKPANIMLRREEALARLTGELPFTAVLTDFGVARMLEGAQITGTGSTIGTPDYMSPEQARGEPAGPSSDIYALGIVLYECLTGELPFTADTPVGMLLKHMNAEPPSVLTKVPHLPEALEGVLTRAMAKQISGRYARAGDMAADLSGIVEALA